MRIVFLGTSASTPTRTRSLSATAILRADELLLFDAGEGVQYGFSKAGLAWNRIMKIFITHMHGDHCLGLPGLLQTMSTNSRTEPVTIYGPPGSQLLIEETSRILGFGLTFQVLFERTRPGIIVEEEEYEVRACTADHSYDSFAYRLTERQRPGVFRRERALKLGVPEGELWSRLQHGESVLVGGRRIFPRQVLGPKRPGRSIGISGDTRPDPLLSGFFRGCDALIFDSTYGDLHADKAVERRHSTAREAAMVARNAEADLLILTHFSARYSDVSSILMEAAEVHPRVIAACDQLAIDIPYP